MTKVSLKITKKKIKEFIANSDLFSHLPPSSIAEISKGFEVTYLAGNKILVKQDDPSDSMYILMYGLLCVIKKDNQGQTRKVSEIKSGSVVGEIGCLFDENRTASIYAIRDCVLLKMTKKTYNELAKIHPEIGLGISKISIKRVVSPAKYTPKRSCTYFSFIPAGNCPNLESFAEEIQNKLNKYGDTLLLTHARFAKLFGRKPRTLESTEVISFLHAIEANYRFIIYLATEKNAWAQHCIRCADKILLIGQYGEDSEINAVEDLLPKKNTIIKPSTELALIYSDPKQTPRNVSIWLKHRRVDNHYNIRLYKTSDIERLTRMITGNALGLVLSGGGSLGLAHVGVIRALQEAKIPIDYVAGTSMGGLVGALVAIELEHDTMVKELEKQLLNFQKNLEYTLPIISLIKARRLDALLIESFGKNIRIEILWQKYFCVSTNINTNELHIHDTGLLWKAIRASLSLPGILPVILNKKHEVLVDGGILNNLPVDILQTKLNGGRILASSIKMHQDPPQKLSYDEYTASGWQILFKYFLMPKIQQSNLSKKMRFINIASIIQSSMIIASNNHQQKMIKLADYNIIMDLNNFSMINFKPINKIVTSGYKQAKKSLRELNIQTK